MQTNFNIESFLDLSGYEATRKNRRKNKGTSGTQEFFTPYSIVKRMCDKVSDEDWADPKKTLLEPSAGSGQFVIYIIWNRLQHGIDWKTALKTCYSVELMQDNVDEMKERVNKMLSQICDDYDEQLAYDIMSYNFVCHDFFNWNFKEWRPMTEEEIKQSKKKK